MINHMCVTNFDIIFSSSVVLHFYLFLAIIREKVKSLGYEDIQQN